MLKVNLGVEGGQSVQEHAEGRSRSVGAGVDVVGPDVIDVISEGASPFGSRMARDAADAPLAFSFRPAILAVVTTTHALGTLLFLSYN